MGRLAGSSPMGAEGEVGRWWWGGWRAFWYNMQPGWGEVWAVYGAGGSLNRGAPGAAGD